MTEKQETPVMYVGGGKIQETIGQDDLFFECKDNGKYWYRKVIRNKRHKITDSDGNVFSGCKTTGKWMHEDDFAVKYINPHKKRVHIVNRSKNWGIQYVEDTFNPDTGWTINPFPAKQA